MAGRQRRSKQRSLRDLSVLGLLSSFTLLSSVVSAHQPYYDSPIIQPQIPLAEPPSLSDTHEFTLRHLVHRGSSKYPNVHKRLDIQPDTRLRALSEDGTESEPVSVDSSLIALSNPLTIQRLADRRLSTIEQHLSAAISGSPAVLSPSAWVMDAVAGPNITDKKTVLALASMTANDYIEEPGTEDWRDVGPPLNYSSSFGWAGDGLRGHIYADKTNSTIVISIKGTSTALFDGYGTTTNDKENDNLLFSCCCGQGGSYLWRQVCDCQSSAYTANLTCISEAVSGENRYYRASIDLYTNVTKLYPDSKVWLTGHSLGGAVASLLGLTFGLPTVTFEAVPEALPAARLGLPSPPGHDPRLPQTRKYTGSYHFGNTADPVYMGTCNGFTSLCTWGGYAMESACHTGQMCVYDTVADKGWGVNLLYHRIKSVIPNVIEDYDDVPPCVAEEECYDCALWKFFKSNGSDSSPTKTTTSTSTPTWTRTSMCKTPGWWGCLDESTTATGPTSTSTSTSTCKTPGWFGCKDPTTTTTETTTTSATTTTCKTPGWFGCKDPTTPATPTPEVSSTSTCTDPGYFWGCNDHTNPSSTPTPTEQSAKWTKDPVALKNHPITSPPPTPFH